MSGIGDDGECFRNKGEQRVGVGVLGVGDEGCGGHRCDCSKGENFGGVVSVGDGGGSGNRPKDRWLEVGRQLSIILATSGGSASSMQR